MAKLETKDWLSVSPGSIKKPTFVEIEVVVALVVQEATMESSHGTCSVSAVACRMDIA